MSLANIPQSAIDSIEHLCYHVFMFTHPYQPHHWLDREDLSPRWGGFYSPRSLDGHRPSKLHPKKDNPVSRFGTSPSFWRNAVVWRNAVLWRRDALHRRNQMKLRKNSYKTPIHLKTFE
jgi:hypothetical protein